MTTNARKRTKRRKRKHLRIACWNITSWTNKDQEILMEANKHRLDICALSETKRKGQGTSKYLNYILLYSGKKKAERAHSGVGLLIHTKYEDLIDDIKYVNDRIIKVSLRMKNSHLHLISVYAPDISKTKEETMEFYVSLQSQIDSIPVKDKVLLMGDLNARIGNEILNGVKHKFNEDVLNENGEILIDFCAQNALRINNTYFPHKWQHKYTWSNTRGQKSIIDYIITNRNIHPTQILDVRVLSSANAGTDHNLVLCKLRLTTPTSKKISNNIVKEKINLESLETPSTQLLYKNRLDKQLEESIQPEEDDVERHWENLKNCITRAAGEALGIKKCCSRFHNCNKPWFCDEVKTLAEEKKRAWLKFRANQIGRVQYTEIRNHLNSEIRKIKQEYWLKFTKDMERDLYGGQKRVWRMLRNRKKPVNEYVQTNKISKETWVRYFRTLFTEDSISSPQLSMIAEDTDISNEDIKNALKKLKNRKASGIDDIPNELIKYGGEMLTEQITILFRNILRTSSIPNEWRTSILIPIFKKGCKDDPNNYRGISLMCSMLKLFTSVIRSKLEQIITINEEQEGFRRNRSTIDAIFSLRQVKEKSIEFDKPAFLCFIDMKKAFDRVRIEDVIPILQAFKVPTDITNCIIDMNNKSKLQVKVSGELTEEIPVGTGIKQGDSLSPFIFNLIMDKIIQSVKLTGRGYQMGRHLLSIVCYADDAVLLAESEDDLQYLLHTYHLAALQYNMVISIEKTKCMSIYKNPLRCKLVVDNQPIEQVMKFKYLGIEFTSFPDLQSEVRQQTNKAAVISGCLRDVVWRNKHMNIESKTRIYKTCVRPLMTYAIETRADTQKTKNALRTTEMRTLRSIAGKTRLDRIRNKDIRNMCEITDVVRWGRARRREWHAHVLRMPESRLPKISMTNKPQGKRLPGRPSKRWRDSWQSTSQENV